MISSNAGHIIGGFAPKESGRYVLVYFDPCDDCVIARCIGCRNSLYLF